MGMDPSQLSRFLTKFFSNCTFLFQEWDLAQGFTWCHAETCQGPYSQLTVTSFMPWNNHPAWNSSWIGMMNFLGAQVNCSSLHSSGPSKGICLICPVAFRFQPEAPELRPFPLPLWPILSRNLSSAYFWGQMLQAALGEQGQFYQTSLTFVLGYVYMQNTPHDNWNK